MLYKFYQKHIFPHLLNQVMQTPSLMDLRRELLLGVAGDVLEIGFGTGLNLPFYQGVDTVYALEPNAAIFELAQQRIDATPLLLNRLPQVQSNCLLQIINCSMWCPLGPCAVFQT